MKLILLTSQRFNAASDCIPIIQASRVCTVARVIISCDQNADRARVWRRKLTKVSKIGLLGAANGIRMRSWYQSDASDLVLVCERLGIPVFETDYTNSDETVRLFKDVSPDLGLSLGNSYISPKVFSVPKYGMINVHGERLPEYQNAQSVIWPIYHLEMTTGLTIHQIERSIDTGNILYREEYPITFCKTLEHTVRKTIEVTRRRTPNAVRYVCDNYDVLLKNAKTQEGGRTFTTPSIKQFYRMVRNNAVLYEKSRRLSPDTSPIVEG
jgi:methionyl-tRNA formyltransferase